MTENRSKKFTAQAKAGIKGEAFFEALISDYSLPHHIVGAKDLGIDYICEWVFGDRPTGILYAVQVKTRSLSNVKLVDLGPHRGFNELNRYRIKSEKLTIGKNTLDYWRGLGMPVYLFLVVYSESSNQHGQLDCYYKRFTPFLTSISKHHSEYFYKVNEGSNFLAFADREGCKYGFVRDLFIDLMRCSYSKGSISYISPRTIGLKQFRDEEAVFGDLIQEYRETVCQTYEKTRRILESLCINHLTPADVAVPSAEISDDDSA